MELCTTIPARRDGTVTVPFDIGGGQKKLYVFTGEPMVCEVEDQGHAAKLLASGNFLTRDDYDDEIEFLQRAAVRNARLKASGQLEAATQSAALAAGSFVPGLGEGAPNPADEEDEAQQDPNSQPEEAGTRPTGRVRKAQGSK